MQRQVQVVLGAWCRHRRDRRAGGLADRSGPRGMVEMRMGAQDPTDASGAGAQNRFHMRRLLWAGIDDRELPLANEVGIRARPGHDTGIGCKNAGDVSIEPACGSG